MNLNNCRRVRRGAEARIQRIRGELIVLFPGSVWLSAIKSESVALYYLVSVRSTSLRLGKVGSFGWCSFWTKWMTAGGFSSETT